MYSDVLGKEACEQRLDCQRRMGELVKWNSCLRKGKATGGNI